MTSETATRLYAHEPRSLLPLLRAHLPHTLVIVGTILANRVSNDEKGPVDDDTPLPPPLPPVYATFPPPAHGGDVTLDTLREAGIGEYEWLVAVALPLPSEQIRLHHALVAATPDQQTGPAKAAAERTIELAIREMARMYPTQLVVGNTHEMFESVTRRVVGGAERTKTYIYVAPHAGFGHTEIDLAGVGGVDKEGLVLDHGRPSDAPVVSLGLDHGCALLTRFQIFETNKYRLEEYYALRGAYTTCLRRRSDTVPNPNPCEVWVMTHGDGSLGALWTQPAFRRRGLAKVVMAEHLAKEEARGVPGFCYIEEGNEASMKLFSSLGWSPLPWTTYWIYERSVADDQEH